VYIKAEHKRATREQGSAESGKDAVGLPLKDPQEQHDAKGKKQVRLCGTEQQRCSGEDGLRLVVVEKKDDAEKQENAKLASHEARHYGRKAVPQQVQPVRPASMQNPKHPNRRHKTGNEGDHPKQEPCIWREKAKWRRKKEGRRWVAHNEQITLIVSGR
jgi:hypothetical protein